VVPGAALLQVRRDNRYDGMTVSLFVSGGKAQYDQEYRSYSYVGILGKERTDRDTELIAYAAKKITIAIFHLDGDD
jgi:hypothetical protein